MSDLSEVNTSELVLMAQDTNPYAHRGLDRETLEQLAIGAEINLPVPSLDTTRLTIMEYILAHWTQVKPLISCPAKTQDPRACFQCTGIQVIECASGNDQIFKWKRKQKENK